jgi:NDP-sugar pyrophosphorylase family protein
VSTLSHALVLTAGLGTRLHPLTEVRAKPAIPVAGEPMARRIIRWLVDGGARDVTLNLHHLPETLTALVGDGSDLGASIRYSWEQPQVLGSAGGPRQALDIVGAGTFFVINGDTLTDVNLHDVADAHARSGALVTLALVPNLEPLRYGGVRVAPDGDVQGFSPRGPSAAGSYHFIGVQAVHRDAFAGVARGRPAPSIGGAYDALIAERPGCIHAFVTDARFWDIGTVTDYWKTSVAFNQWTGRHDGEGVNIAPSARVVRSILWDNIEIGAGVMLDECIVTDGVRVPAGATYRHAILLRTAGGETAATPFEVD